jgi:hypothetical protein
MNYLSERMRPDSPATPPEDRPARRHSCPTEVMDPMDADPQHGRTGHLLIPTVNSLRLARRLVRLPRHPVRALRRASANSVSSQGTDLSTNEQTPLKLASFPEMDILEDIDKKEWQHDNGIEEEPDDPPSTAHVIIEIVFGKGLVSLCLVAAPLAVLAVHLNWSDTWIFWLNFITILPLAAILGDFTEELALHTNETIGGLINASFGNAVEVVIAINALMAGEIRVVQASLLGSIFSNLLLVLGCCFFFGGLVHKVRPQVFYDS